MSEAPLARILALLACAATASAQLPLRTIHGDAAGDQLGASVAGLGDADLDGWPDVIAGAPGADRGGPRVGLARVWSGRDGRVLLDLVGQAPGDELGREVSAAADVDGDGRQDLLVRSQRGATVYDIAGTPLLVLPGETAAAAGDVDRDGHGDLIAGFSTGGPSNGGYALVLAGRDGRVLWQLDGEAAGDGLAVVAGAGDVDGDGFDDVIAGAPASSNGRPGYARVHSGRTGSVLHRFSASTFRYGAAVAGIADLDQDGFDDVAIGAPGLGTPCDPGQVEVRSGRDGSVLRRILGRVFPTCRQVVETGVGARLAPAGDLDGDGAPDLAVASAQRLRVVSLLRGVDLLVLAAGGTGFAGSFAGAADLDHDGVMDLVVGDPLEASNGVAAGAVAWLPGKDRRIAHERHLGLLDGGRLAGAAGPRGVESPRPELLLAREGAYSFPPALPRVELLDAFSGALLHVHSVPYFGTLPATPACAGDLDGDQVSDWIVGWHDGSLPKISFVETLSGKDLTVLRTLLPAQGDRFGIAVAGLADWDRDGRIDLTVGSDRGGANGGGYVEVWSGQSDLLLHRFDGAAAGDAFGAAVCVAGDTDGDGTGDLAIGAPGADAVELRSTRTGALLRGVRGPKGSAFGQVLASAGDVDRDGRADLWVGAPAFAQGAGAVLLVAGGRIVWQLQGSPGDALGSALDGGQDLDRDGAPDLLAGAPGADLAGLDSGATLAISGRDGSVLCMALGDAAGDGFGTFAVHAGEASGSGWLEVWAGAPRGGFGFAGDASFAQLGYGRVLTLDRGTFSVLGTGCTGSAGQPRLRATGQPVLGGEVHLALSHLVPHGAGVLLLGSSDQATGGTPLPLSLAPLGATGCVLRISDDALLPLVADPSGRVTLSLTIPTWPATGAVLFAQHLALDAAANALGVALGPAGRLIVGR